MGNLKFIDSRIEEAKNEMIKLYEVKGYIDFEVLRLSEKVDKLILKRYRMIREFVN